MYVAVLFGAVNADTVQRVGGNPRPHDLFPAVKPQLRAVAALCRMEPEQDLQLESKLLRVVADLSQIPPPPPQGHVVGAALEEARGEVPRQPVAQPRDVLA